MGETILVVEDDLSLQETLAYNLTRQGYTVETAGDGLIALDAARRLRPDLIVLDIMLPGMDGFEVCRVLRKEMSTPILMLTARDDEIDRIVGLEVGADDYLTKPFSMRELMARVKAMLRRVRMILEDAAAATAPDAAPILGTTMEFGNLTINLTRREVLLDGQPLSLKPKVYDLLVYMAQHRGEALSRESVLENVWGWEYMGESRTVDVHVRWLREKIEADPANPTRLITVRSAGYRFEG